MVNCNKVSATREVFLLAIQANQVVKWDNSLNLHKHPTHVDKVLKETRDSCIKQVEDMINESKEKMARLREK
jgi:hypothetical protein